MNELVSVIVPVYNVEKYIERCLLSIMQQTYKTLEIIVINDGSTDLSYDICNRYAEFDNRIILISQRNEGQASARNCGLDLSTGKYITFVDSDDWLLEEAIERMVSAAETNRADICIGDLSIITENEPFNYSMPLRIPLPQLITKTDAWMNLFTDNHLRFGCIWGKIYAKKLFSELRFPKGMTYEDLYISQEIYNLSKCIIALDEKIYYYFQRKDSTTHFWSDKKIRDSLVATRHRLDFFCGIGDRELLKKAIELHLKHSINCYYWTNSNATKRWVLKQFKKCRHNFSLVIENKLDITQYFIFESLPLLYPSIKNTIEFGVNVLKRLKANIL